MEIFAKRLKELREEKGYSARHMGEVLEMNYRSYLDYEYFVSQPSLEILVKLAQFFNVTTDYLLGLAEV